MSRQADKHQAHFIDRARARFGLKLTPERYQFLIRKVKDHLPGTSFLYHQPPGRTVWRIRAGGQYMRVVFDHQTDRLVTCLYCANDPRHRKNQPCKS